MDDADWKEQDFFPIAKSSILVFKNIKSKCELWLINILFNWYKFSNEQLSKITCEREEAWPLHIKPILLFVKGIWGKF